MSVSVETLVVIQARMSSTRLPGKVLLDLAGKPVLHWVIRAAKAIPGASGVVVATSDHPDDLPIAQWCEAQEVDCLRGPLDDVLRRFTMAAEQYGAKHILRITADCPFLDPWAAGLVIAALVESGCAFATNADSGTWPDGLDAEAIDVGALKAADLEASSKVEREHVTPFIKRHRQRFRLVSLPCPLMGIGHLRWTLDTPEDLEYLRRVATVLPQDRPPTLPEMLALLRNRPDLTRHSAPARNEGYPGLLPAAKDEPPSFEKSNTLLHWALKTVPTASQTFSKSALQLPSPHAPLFLSHGLGGRVWDVDGNEYVDMMCSLLAVSIGYCDPEIDEAIRRQMGRGISFSLPTLLEGELAERLVEVVPAAEMVRYGKNGSDATSAAVRVARAYTGRDRVIVCGYHGWQDWYIGSTARNKGVPDIVSGLTHSVPYNDLTAIQSLFDAHDGEIAAIIMEPASFQEPMPGYLQSVKDIAHARGAVLIFDEIVTGFRFALGGAQEMFGVTPDLACIGKGMGNGMPISAVVGRADLMREMEDIFFSGTFGGEALSLAASIAVIDLMRREPVIQRFWELGGVLQKGIADAITSAGLANCFSIKGWAPWTLTVIDNAEGARKEAIRTLFLRELIARGVLGLGAHNICYRHSDFDISHTLRAYGDALDIVAAELRTGALEQRLGHAAIEPIFQVRKAPAAKTT